MRILGIDYGRKKIGLAIGDTDIKFAEPLQVLRFSNLEEGLIKVSQVCKVSMASKIVIGLSEGKSGEETKEFGHKLQKELQIPINYHDETLSTADAQKLSIEAGIKRKKRKDFEDAFAAALMLQNYLEIT